jgi:hypothetical protein
MTALSFVWLVARALYELVRYDVVYARRGFRGVTASLADVPLDATPARMNMAAVEAVVWAVCCYWKPVRCLQRAVCTVRLLRRDGVAARVVIGYRPQPFLSHAWVEVAGRVVNDSPAYQRHLRVLQVL